MNVHLAMGYKYYWQVLVAYKIDVQTTMMPMTSFLLIGPLNDFK